MMAAAGLHVPEFEELEVKEGVAADLVEELVARFGLPVGRQARARGLDDRVDHRAATSTTWPSGLVLAARYDRRVLVQRFVTGTEITVGVLATPDVQVLPTLEIVSDNPVYDYDAKYTAGKSHHIIPARIPEPAQDGASDAAAACLRRARLRGHGASRHDRRRRDGTPWVLEVNTVPGLTELSLLPDAARAAGISFDDLCQRLVDHAIGRHARRVGPPAG